MSHDFRSFVLSWLSSPRRVGAIAPSGEALAELITREIGPASGPVIELGPGTGVFTYKILERGVRQQDLTLVEYGSEFVRVLQLRFPGARVLWMDASRLGTTPILKEGTAGAVISGLPLLTMSPRKVHAILGGAFRHLRKDGAFYQFTYGPRCPIPRPLLDRLGLKATLLDRTLQNLPPAAVYRLTRRSPSRFAANTVRELGAQPGVEGWTTATDQEGPREARAEAEAV
ncbi:SAM-dependent methyltransferase [Bradyrhizobium prioriisuperbiae]|uniref:class I SAM-dependent methyltransferase n=1 Tax=Bradyrhizobium prioriisuperbiae TaxID=2854389 RepID=UPI0028E4AC4D|nr:SAM-dependent methyltransferase [Bradyrhizobium prioritasuperba]